MNDLYIAASIMGIFTGLGTSLGQWISNRLLIKHFESLEKKIIKRLSNGKKSHS